MAKKSLIILFVTAVLITYLGRMDISRAPFSDIPDVKNYRMMAEAAPGFDTTVSRNFGYRILMPYIVGIMPLEVDDAFYLAAVLLSLLVPLVFYRFLREYGLKDDTSIFLTFLFLLNKHTFGFPVWDPYDVHDLLTHIFILLFFIALKKNNFILMGIYLLIGVINRETILFIVPAAFTYYFFMKKDKDRTFKLILSALPAVILLTILRSVIITESAAGKGVVYSLGKLHFDESNKMFNPVTYYRIVNTFIPLTFIPLIYFRKTIDFFKQNIHFLIFTAVYYSSCFLAGDTERLIAPVFPVFFLLTGKIFENIELKGMKEKLFILFAAVISLPHHIYFRFTLPSRNIKVAISLITLTAVTSYFIYRKRKNEILNNNTGI